MIHREIKIETIGLTVWKCSRNTFIRGNETYAYLTTNENDETPGLAEGTNWDWALLSIRDSRPRYRLRTCWTRRRWLRCPRDSLAVIRFLFTRDETEMHEFRLVIASRWTTTKENARRATFCTLTRLLLSHPSFPVAPIRSSPKGRFLVETRAGNLIFN